MSIYVSMTQVIKAEGSVLHYKEPISGSVETLVWRGGFDIRSFPSNLAEVFISDESDGNVWLSMYFLKNYMNIELGENVKSAEDVKKLLEKNRFARPEGVERKLTLRELFDVKKQIYFCAEGRTNNGIAILSASENIWTHYQRQFMR